MGLLTIPMGLLLLLGALAGVALALGGAPGWTLLGAAWFAGGCALLLLAYRGCELLEASAQQLQRAGRIGAARAAALCFGLGPTLAVVAFELAVARALLPPPGSGAWPAAGWTYAVATGPATLLAWRATLERRTLWQIRAYAAHLSGWALLAFAHRLPGPWLAAVVALPIVLPAAVGALIARADPDALQVARL